MTGSRVVHWATFFSDTEHEVEEVISGHRLTLTYNLFVEKPLRSSSIPPNLKSSPFYIELSAQLKNPKFLPYGGILGFGLKHQYPVSDRSDFSGLADSLKGVDLLIYKTGQALGLRPKLTGLFDKVPTRDGDVTILSNYCTPFSSANSNFWIGDNTSLSDILDYSGGEIIRLETEDEDEESDSEDEESDLEDEDLDTEDEDSDMEDEDSDSEDEDSDMEDEYRYMEGEEKLHWVLRDRKNNGTNSAAINYGNDATIELMYGSCILIMRVPPRYARR
jgi:hypothetical protein